MTASTPMPHVAVLGAGILGVSSAVHLARLGARVTLVSERRPADGASGRSLSWLNSARFRSPAYHTLRMAGIDRYRTLAARHDVGRWLRFDGGLTWDADDATNEIARVHAHERSIGYDSQLLSPERVAAVTPGVDPRCITPQGAIFNPGEGWVDLPSLVGWLLDAFSALGGRLVTEAGAATVTHKGGRATGVALPDGPQVAADAVLVAAGADTPRIAASFGQAIPEASPVALLLRTKPLRHRLRAVLNTPRVAVRPTPNGALVCDSAWAEAEVGRRADGTFEVRDSTVAGLLREVSAVLEDHPQPELETYGVGPKPVPKDGDPVFGPLDALAGCYVAFSHSGATLGLIAGELLAGEIVSGEPHGLLAPFRASRFAAAR